MAIVINCAMGGTVGGLPSEDQTKLPADAEYDPFEDWSSARAKDKANLSLPGTGLISDGSFRYGPDSPTNPCVGSWQAWQDVVVGAGDVADALVAAEKPLLFNGLYINGRLDLNEATISRRVSFNRCVFSEGIQLRRATALRLEFKECVFLGKRVASTFEARGAEVNGGLALTKSWIDGGVDASEIHVTGSLNLDGVHVQMPAERRETDRPTQSWAVDLTNAKIDGDARLVSCELDGGGLSLISTQVGLQLALSDAKIAASCSSGRAIDAQRCTVGEDALLRREKSLLPSRPKFRGRVWLFGIRVGGNLSVDGADFQPAPRNDASATVEPHGLMLSNSHIAQRLHLGAEFARGSKITLEHCEATELELGDPKTLDGRWKDTSYFVNGLRYKSYSAGDDEDDLNSSREDDEVLLRWIRNAADQQSTRPWITAANVAESEGHPSTYLKAMRAASHRVATRPERIFLRPFGYGFRPSMAVVPLLAIGLVILMQTIHTLGLHQGFIPHTVGSTTTLASECDDSKGRCVVPLYYAVDAVLPFDLQQTSTWIPNRDATAGRLLDDLLVAAKLASWLFTGVFIAAVAGKLKRTS